MTGGVDQVTLRRRGTGLMGYDPAQAGDGYTLYAPQTGDGAVHLIDMKGTRVHSWKMPLRPGRHAVLLPNGNMGYAGNLPGTRDLYAAWMLWHGGWFCEVTPEGKIVWEHTDPTHHHDVQWLPNGNLLYGALEPLPAEFARRIVGGSSAHDPADGIFFGDVIKEVNRKGETVWQWRACDHLDPEEFPVHDTFDHYHWPMINGVFAASNDIVLLSLRTTSGVIGVARASGEPVIRIKHPLVAQQHTPVELDNGNILIFDNGNWRFGQTSPASRIIEVEPGSNRIVWQYSDPMRSAFFSPYMGAAQRLPNGNTHITESASGRLFDVTPAGDVVWEFVIPEFAEYPEDARAYVPGFHNSVFRSYRYDRSQIPWL